MFSVASFFAGVGGIDLGFEETGEFKTVYANEFDSYASETFEMNYPTVKVDQRDIHLVPVEDVPKTDVIIGGFPCQAFSIAGYRQGFEDKKGRGELFFELMRMVEAKKPRVALFENVKNPMRVSRYHSLIVDKDNLPSCLEITSETQDEVIMGIKHKEYEIHGVQFHPEAEMTEAGHSILKNFINITKKKRSK